MQLLTSAYLEIYTQQLPLNWVQLLAELQRKPNYEAADFEYYLQVSATYSSNIEGNSIDFDTYLKNKHFQIKSKPKEMAEIDDLVKAYHFAMTHPLTPTHFLEAHRLLSQSILSLKSQRGKLRQQPVGIFSGGKIEYMAVEPDFVAVEFAKLFADIDYLLSRNLTHQEVFYYASMIHLIFEKIHPFMDGNGRAGRLLEKWFLAVKISSKMWSIASEKYYAQHRAEYYQKIHIGYNYYALKMEKCVPFLLMLPASLQTTPP